MAGNMDRLRGAARTWGTIPGELRIGFLGLLSAVGAVVVTTFNDLSATEQYFAILCAGGGTSLGSLAFWSLVTRIRLWDAERDFLASSERTQPALHVGAARWNGTPHAYVDSGRVEDVEIHVGLATTSTPNSVSMFYLEVAGHRWPMATVITAVTPNAEGYQAFYDDSGLGHGTRLGGPFLELPVRMTADDAASGWIGFLPFSRITFEEARSQAAYIIAACANGAEVRQEVRIPPPPAERSPV